MHNSIRQALLRATYLSSLLTTGRTSTERLMDTSTTSMKHTFQACINFSPLAM